MQFSALRAFVKVAQTGSFTRAATALSTQKAHLSRVIGQLENELGVRLFDRTTRSLSLTEVGREFHERAVGILASVEDAHHAVQRSQGEPRGTLRLTCGVEFGMIAVTGWINQYLALYPQASIEADFTNRTVDIVHEGFDLAIRVGPLADSTLAARKLGELAYGLFASPEYLARRAGPADPSELDRHDLLMFSGGNHRDTLHLVREDERRSIELAPRLKANNVFAVRDAAVASLGVAKLPHVVAERDLQAGHLQSVLTEWRLPTVPVHAVFASVRYLTPKVRSFIDLAVEAMQLPSN